MKVLVIHKVFGYELRLLQVVRGKLGSTELHFASVPSPLGTFAHEDVSKTYSISNTFTEARRPARTNGGLGAETERSVSN